MQKTRCLFSVESVAKLTPDWEGDARERIVMSACHDGTPEGQQFSKATPSGRLEFELTNPAVVGTYEPGQLYYIDITPKSAD